MFHPTVVNLEQLLVILSSSALMTDTLQKLRLLKSYDKMRIEMITIRKIIWDEWNKQHIVKHRVSPIEVMQVFAYSFQAKESYKGRLLIKGRTNRNRKLNIVLSPEDRNQKAYPEGTFYLITAFEPNE